MALQHGLEARATLLFFFCYMWGFLQDFVGESVVNGLVGFQPQVAVAVFLDIFGIFARVFGQDIIKPLAQSQDFLGLDLQIGGRSLHHAGDQRLVQQDPAVGQHKSFAFGAAGKQDRAHTCRLPDAIGGYIAAQKLHRVIDGQPGGDHAAGGVDVKMNVGFIVFVAQKQHLGDDQIGDIIVDAAAEKNDPVFQQPGENIVGPFAAAALFNNNGY